MKKLVLGLSLMAGTFASNAFACDLLDIGGIWKSKKSGRVFKLIQNGCEDVTIQDLQKGFIYEIDSKARKGVDVTPMLLKNLNRRMIPIQALKYRGQLVPLTNKSTQLLIKMSASFSLPQNESYASAQVTADAHLQLAIQDEYVYNQFTKQYQIVQKRNILELRMDNVRAASLTRRDGKVEDDGAALLGANLVLKVADELVEDVTTERFIRIKEF